MTLNSFQVEGTPEIICVLIWGFCLCLGLFWFGFFCVLFCFCGLVCLFVVVNNCFSICYIALCVCFQNWPIQKSVKTFSFFFFWFINLMPDCSNLI